MVGCHDGVIVGCEFRHQAGLGNGSGVQAKGGSEKVAIRRCRFDHAGSRGVNLGGGTGLPLFRPLDATHEAADLIVEDCEFTGSMAAVVFDAVERGIVRHNTIREPGRWATRILQGNTDARFARCREGRFENNLIVFRSDQIRPQRERGSEHRAEDISICGQPVVLCRSANADPRTGVARFSVEGVEEIFPVQIDSSVPAALRAFPFHISGSRGDGTAQAARD